MRFLIDWLLVLAVLLCAERSIAGGDDAVRGSVVDPSQAALPGVTVRLLDGAREVASAVTAPDGGFTLAPCPPGGRVVASGPGFETASVPCADAARIVLRIAGTKETVEVSARAAPADSPTGATIATQISETTLQRLPAVTPHAREKLSLLPSVVRGPDGLLRIDGVRPHESPLLLDGFDVTDPATGLSSIDPSVETVRSVEVLRDPMAITLGGALGSFAAIETRTGGDAFEAGIQGFIPRPRLTGGGFGRLEGFSPRAFVGGRHGAVRGFASGEFDFDRIPVPGVTTASGTPDTKQVGGTLFARADAQMSKSNILTVEGLLFPMDRERYGLSPLRSEAASPTLRERDVFGGLVDRHVLGTGGMISLRVSVLVHRTALRPRGSGSAEITPSGWAATSFSTQDRTATRVGASASWQKNLQTSSGTHRVTVQADFATRRLRGTVAENSVQVLDDDGRLVREIRYGPAASIAAADRTLGITVRDTWRVSDSFQLDGGVRGDVSSLGGFAPSARLGFRYGAGAAARTVIKGGAGTFVGTLPLSVRAFAGFPTRFDDGLLQPRVGGLALPRATAVNARVERRLAPGWDAVVGLAYRRASRLATLDVLRGEGSLRVSSTGDSRYREAEAAISHTWGAGNQLFVSYTRSSARGEINDFATLFAAGDVEILRPGARARIAADARHRVLAWGSVELPAGFAVSPALEWHSGFPYSVVDARRAFVGPPNDASFPPFFSLDLVVDKQLTVGGRRVKLQVQVFNVTDHFNPRDVFAVAGSARFGALANSVGPTVRGDIALGW